MRRKKKPATHKATIIGRVIKSLWRIKTSTGKVMASLTLEAESDTRSTQAHIIATPYSATDDPSTTSQRKSRRNRKCP